MKTMNETKIAFLGGDMRTLTVAKLLHGEGMNICTWGTPQDAELVPCRNIYSAIDGADAVVLPLPASSDGVTLNIGADDVERPLALSAIADATSADAVIIGGKLPKAFCDYAGERGIKCFDYFESEAFQINNAYTTAEAALSIVMNKLPKNIRGARFAVTGYGRISKQLVTLLRTLGASVTVAARRDSDLAWAALSGAAVLKLPHQKGEQSNIFELCNGYDVIFNTVPIWLFDEPFLEKLNSDTIIIDLASSPGGVDIAQAKRLRKKVLWATSLPGKYAPQSAGELIADCVRKIIESEVSE